jgi:hypothetical protein
LANGSPIGLALAKPQVAAKLTGLTISSSAATRSPTAARAVPDFIEEHNLPANGTQAGAYLRGRLAELKGQHEIIGDVRGMALGSPRAGRGSQPPRRELWLSKRLAKIPCASARAECTAMSSEFRRP